MPAAPGKDSPLLRAAAGVISLFFTFAAVLILINGDKEAGLTFGLFLLVLPLVFGWYALRGRNGLPRFLTREVGARPEGPRE